MLPGDRAGCGQNALEDLPAAGRIDEALVFGAAPVGNVGRFRPAQPFVGEKAAAQRSVGQKLDALVSAKRGQRAGRAAIDQRKRNLVGGERHAVGQRERQVRGVEIGDAERPDQTFVAQPRHFVQRVEPGRMLERPPVELQEVDAVDAEPVEPLLHAGTHDGRSHRPGFRAPFGEGERPCGGGPVARQQPAGDQLGAAIVIGHVERVEAGGGIGFECIGTALRIERRAALFQIRDLPQAADQAAHGEPVAERDAVRNLRHGRCSRWLLAARPEPWGGQRAAVCRDGAKPPAPRPKCRADATAGWRRAPRRS